MKIHWFCQHQEHMPKTIRPLRSPELTQALFNLGSRTLVLVEGKTDKLVFDQLFSERLGRIEFYPAGGKLEVEYLLNDVSHQRNEISVFGICDRDFADASDVKKRLQEPGESLFLLTWYSIDNYLLDPEALSKTLSNRHFQTSSVETNDDISTDAISVQLLQLCHRLRTMMAANWVLREEQQQEFGSGHEILSRDDLIDQIQKRTGWLKPEAKRRLAAKEVEIDSALIDLESAHTRISGKHLLNQICILVQSKGIRIRSGYLFDELLDWLKTNKTPHPHLTRIIDEKILGSEPNPV